MEEESSPIVSLFEPCEVTLQQLFHQQIFLGEQEGHNFALLEPAFLWRRQRINNL